MDEAIDRASSGLTPSLADIADSGRAGNGGARSALLVGLCGLFTDDFLLPGEPGTILLNVYDENRLEARRSSGSDRCSAARVERVACGTSCMVSVGGGGGVLTVGGGMSIKAEGRLRRGKAGVKEGTDSSDSASVSGRVPIVCGGL